MTFNIKTTQQYFSLKQKSSLKTNQIYIGNNYIGTITAYNANLNNNDNDNQ